MLDGWEESIKRQDVLEKLKAIWLLMLHMCIPYIFSSAVILSLFMKIKRTKFTSTRKEEEYYKKNITLLLLFLL